MDNYPKSEGVCEHGDCLHTPHVTIESQDGGEHHLCSCCSVAMHAVMVCRRIIEVIGAMFEQGIPEDAGAMILHSYVTAIADGAGDLINMTPEVIGHDIRRDIDGGDPFGTWTV